MIDVLLIRSDMARHTDLATFLRVLCICHSQTNRLFVGPVAGGVRTEPGRSGPVTTFAADAVSDVKAAGPFVSGHIRSVAIEADGFGLWLVDLQVARDLF